MHPALRTAAALLAVPFAALAEPPAPAPAPSDSPSAVSAPGPGSAPTPVPAPMDHSAHGGPAPSGPPVGDLSAQGAGAMGGGCRMGAAEDDQGGPGMQGGQKGGGGMGGRGGGHGMGMGMGGPHGMHQDVVHRLDLIEARMAKIEAMLETLMRR